MNKFNKKTLMKRDPLLETWSTTIPQDGDPIISIVPPIANAYPTIVLEVASGS